MTARARHGKSSPETEVMMAVTALTYPASNGEKDAQSKPEAANPEAEQLRDEHVIPSS